MKCHNCGNELTPGAPFCGNCGAPVQAMAQPQQPIPQQVLPPTQSQQPPQPLQPPQSMYGIPQPVMPPEQQQQWAPAQPQAQPIVPQQPYAQPMPQTQQPVYAPQQQWAAPGVQMQAPPMPGPANPFAGQPSNKSYLTTFLFAFFLGGFGVDRFYTEQIGLGIAKLLTGWLTLFIWPLIDVIILLAGGRKDKYGRELYGKDKDFKVSLIIFLVFVGLGIGSTIVLSFVGSN